MTQKGRRGRWQQRDKTRRGQTIPGANEGIQARRQVALSTARLLTFVIRVQILRHCVRQSTTHYSSMYTRSWTPAWRISITGRLAVVLACTTPSRPSYMH